ncbi:hypothetical protein [Gallaecimonas mangrovi]|uniref:hypothetical protein n=1 Tax=Gallaecimonas mangrovi TaxID=2291597 RepID=UPI0012601074|nr:hypothetical protein [Gallaecimonas mangrovi]
MKYEEWANTLLLAIGLMAFCSFTYPRSLPLSKHGWQGWLLLTIGVSIMALGRSAKLRHATEVLGAKGAKIAALFSTLTLLPMLIAVGLYAFS